MKKQDKPKPLPIKFQWIEDRYAYRVWRTDWFGDQFEVLSLVEFQTLEAICKRFGISFEENME